MGTVAMSNFCVEFLSSDIADEFREIANRMNDAEKQIELLWDSPTVCNVRGLRTDAGASGILYRKYFRYLRTK